MTAENKQLMDSDALRPQLVAQAGDIEQPFIDQAGAFLESRVDQEPPWLTQLRSSALSAFKAVGFPHRRIEEWKYTDWRAAMRLPLEFVSSGPDIAPEVLQPALSVEGIRIIMIDGKLAPSLSTYQDVSGVTVVSLLDEPTSDWFGEHFGRLEAKSPKAMAAFDNVFMTSCIAIKIGQGVKLKAPLHVISLSTESQVHHHIRSLILAAPGSEASVVEEHFSSDAKDYYSGFTSEIVVQDKAELRHYKIQRQSESSLHLGTTFAEIGSDASLECFCLHAGSDRARTDLHADLAGEGGHFGFSGAYVGEGAQASDMTTVIEHSVPNCTSREVVRGVLDGKAKGVFQGKIVVHEGAQKTDGYQMSRAILLSDKAEVDAKPELEIFADDVKCSHGATAGELDENSIFYLRSRGIPEGEAKALLIEGFLDEAVDEISSDELKSPLKGVVSDWLREHTRFAQGESL